MEIEESTKVELGRLEELNLADVNLSPSQTDRQYQREYNMRLTFWRG